MGTWSIGYHVEDPQSDVDNYIVDLSSEEWSDITRFVALGGYLLEQENEKKEGDSDNDK